MGINLREVEKRAVSDAHNRTSEITQTIGTYIVRHIRVDAVGDVDNPATIAESLYA